MTIKLWELSADLDAIAEEITANDGEITPEMEERLAALEGAFDEKVERVALYIRQMQVNAAAAKAEKDRIAAIEKRYTAKADNLKLYLLQHMTRQGSTKVETPKCRVSVVKSGVPSISWTGPQFMIPEGYRHITIKPDLKTVQEDLAEGRTPPEGFVVEHGKHIRIK
jgi:hypothetical protein